MSDEDALNRVRTAKDQKAFAEIEANYRPALLAIATRMVGASDAEDVVQRALEAVWKGAATFDAARGTARQWVLRIGRNAAIDVLNERSRHRGQDPASRNESSVTDDDARLAILEGQSAAETPNPLWRLRERELWEVLATCLSQRDRDVVWLHAMEGLTHEQIGNHLGLSNVAVRGAYSRATLKLRSDYRIQRRLQE